MVAQDSTSFMRQGLEGKILIWEEILGNTGKEVKEVG